MRMICGNVVFHFSVYITHSLQTLVSDFGHFLNLHVQCTCLCIIHVRPLLSVSEQMLYSFLIWDILWKTSTYTNKISSHFFFFSWPWAQGWQAAWPQAEGRHRLCADGQLWGRSAPDDHLDAERQQAVSLGPHHNQGAGGDDGGESEDGGEVRYRNLRTQAQQRLRGRQD